MTRRYVKNLYIKHITYELDGTQIKYERNKNATTHPKSFVSMVDVVL